MKYFLNRKPEEIPTNDEYIGGQLLIPSTQHKNWQGDFGIVAGSFSEFDATTFKKLLYRDKTDRLKCKFITMPSVENNPERTLEIFSMWELFIPLDLRVDPWPITFVAYEGIEYENIPWEIAYGIYLAGSEDWQDTEGALDLIKTALVLSKYVHISSVNTQERFLKFHILGAHSCDGIFPF